MTADGQPIAVTGLGAVSAWGWGVEPLWRGLVSGRTAIGPLRRFAGQGHRTAVAAEVPPLDDEPREELARRVPGWADLSLAECFALAAALEAVAGAGGLPSLAGGRPETVGVFFGGSTAGMLEGEEVFAEPPGRPLGRRGLEQLAAQPLDVPAATVARHLGLGGPVVTVSSACASGTQALGAALDALRSGEVEVALAGGADSLCRLTYAGFNALRVVDERPCRPFRAGRQGMSLGEGAGVVVLEPEERARRRGAPVLARLLGVGNSCDAHHMTAPHPEGVGAALALERALRDAGHEGGGAAAVAFVNAHGTGTPMNDLSEWRGMARVFGAGAEEIPLTAGKASVGHLLGSSGAIEAVATVRCLLEGLVHPTPASEEAGAELDPETPARLVLGECLPLGERAGSGPGLALSTSFGFGGANAAAVFAPGEGPRS
jgi:3-oxoacyl-[acyl-carrier-protein] synthase II